MKLQFNDNTPITPITASTLLKILHNKHFVITRPSSTIYNFDICVLVNSFHVYTLYNIYLTCESYNDILIIEEFMINYKYNSSI